MKKSVEKKLELLHERHEEISALLSDPATIADQNSFRRLSQEFAQLKPLADEFTVYLQAQQDLQAATEMLSDPEIGELVQEEICITQKRIEQLQWKLQKLLLPQDSNDSSNVFLEIRAGTGGDEAAIFAGDLFRMYSRYAESKFWKIEILNESPGEHGGYREIISRVVGSNVYSQLKFESGAHRVQRIPETESQGRVHTSAATVAVMPESDELQDITINPADLRVDTYRASGAGGQHVNKTDSAVRLTHLPSGIVVECQDERSQHKNRARATALLSARLLTAERTKREQEQATTRRNLIGSGDRSERIRTYNFPQGRLTDHRINLTLYKLEEIMRGQLELVINELVNEHQADQLTLLSQDE